MNTKELVEHFEETRANGGNDQDSSLSLARHWHCLVEQRHGYSHGEIVFSGG